jgi:ABC-2 type transport system permease protein
VSLHRSGVTAFSAHRVGAMVMRYVYLLRTSWPRVLDLIYWPAVQMITWGFLQTFVSHAANQGIATAPFAMAAGTLIGAVLLWDMLFRGQLGFSISFLEEMWSRNIANLLMSPLRPLEFIASLMVMSVIRLAIGLVPVTGLAIWFFGYNLWGLGLALAAFFANLIMTSWSVGLVVSGLVLRHGMGAEAFAWSIMFLMMPLACVYYPVSVMPHWLQYIAWCLPPTYVFEGFRALVQQQVFRSDLMLRSFVMNIGLFAIAVEIFLRLLNSARRSGSLLQMGE